MSRIERGTVYVGLGIVGRLVDALGCEPAEFFQPRRRPRAANVRRQRQQSKPKKE
jgi:hypothetical protein